MPLKLFRINRYINPCHLNFKTQNYEFYIARTNLMEIVKTQNYEFYIARTNLMEIVKTQNYEFYIARTNLMEIVKTQNYNLSDHTHQKNQMVYPQLLDFSWHNALFLEHK